jgi:hypothetical protein
MPTPDASQFTQLKKYSAINTGDKGQVQQKTITHLYQPVPSVSRPIDFLASFTNKYTNVPGFVPINRVTGRHFKPKVPGGSVNGQTSGGSIGGETTYIPPVVNPSVTLVYNTSQGTSFEWGGNTFTRSKGFSYTATLTSIPASRCPSPTQLTSITIDNSVTSIGGGAFFACSALTTVTIGNSVTSIGQQAFNNCTALTTVTIGNSVTTIGFAAFGACSALTSIAIPSSVTSIGFGTFGGCTSLTTVFIANGQLGKTSPTSNPPGVDFFGKTVATQLPV